MLNEIEELLSERNLQFQSKVIQNPDTYEFDQRVPKYPILFLTCMDPRIDVYQIFQFNPGDVFILRNAGNIYTMDMMRSILIAIHKYKVKHIIVLGHLDCGMTKINIKEFRQNLSNEFLKRISINYSDLLSKLNNFFKPFDNEIHNIIKQMNDLQEIKTFFPYVEITGMLYDIQSGWIFTKEDFKDLLIEENHFKIYKGLFYEKSKKLSKFLEINNNQTSKERIDDVQLTELNQQEETDFSELKETNLAIKEHEDLPESINNENVGFQIVIPKIKIPKIYMPKLKIYVSHDSQAKDN